MGQAITCQSQVTQALFVQVDVIVLNPTMKLFCQNKIMIDCQHFFKVLLCLSKVFCFLISIPTPSHFFPKQILKPQLLFSFLYPLEKLLKPLQGVMLQSPIGLKTSPNGYDNLITV